MHIQRKERTNKERGGDWAKNEKRLKKGKGKQRERGGGG